jgi:phosphatidylserine/phosphatidylglycerophosphate/cardiolipin synthase-like enzyme
LNEESNVCLYDPTLAGELEEIFKTDLAACNQVELETWKRRGLLTKMGGSDLKRSHHRCTGDLVHTFH